MDYIFIVSKYLEGLELLLSCTVCIEWRSRLLKDWKMWKRRLYEDYGPMKRIKRTVNNVTTFSWRDTYLMKVNEEATSELKYYYLFYFNMFHAWYDDHGKRQSELRKENLVAFCKKRRGLRIMKKTFKEYLNISGGTYDDDAWQSQVIEKVQFSSFREQFQVRKGKKSPIKIGGILVRY